MSRRVATSPEERREMARERNRRYYEAHREDVLARNRELRRRPEVQARERERRRRWQAEHHDARMEAQRQWRASSDYDARWRAEHREALNAYQRARYAALGEEGRRQRRVYAQKYRQENHERVRAREREWARAYRNANREKVRKQGRAHHARWREVNNERMAVRAMIGNCREEAVRAAAVQLYRLRKAMRVKG